MDKLIVPPLLDGDGNDTIQNIDPADIEFCEIIEFRNRPFPLVSKSAPAVQIFPKQYAPKKGRLNGGNISGPRNFWEVPNVRQLGFGAIRRVGSRFSLGVESKRRPYKP